MRVPTSTKVVGVEVIKVDKETLKHHKFILGVPKTSEEMSDEEILKFVTVNVGDFVRLPNKAIYRRIRGGWRAATDEDLAEFIASQL